MSFKIHLLIISIIILIIYFVSQFLLQPKVSEVTIQAAPVSKYFLSIVDATWGANCRKYTTGTNASNIDNKPLVKENNVLLAVSNLCNNKPNCTIPINIETLGADPLPSCGYKTLQVNYRCFLTDKLNSVEASQGVLTIDCDKLLAPQ